MYEIKNRHFFLFLKLIAFFIFSAVLFYILVSFFHHYIHDKKIIIVFFWLIGSISIFLSYIITNYIKYKMFFCYNRYRKND